MNRPQYAIMEGNLGNVFAVDSLTGRIYAVGELVYSYRNVSTVLWFCGRKGSFTPSECEILLQSLSLLNINNKSDRVCFKSV